MKHMLVKIEELVKINLLKMAACVSVTDLWSSCQFCHIVIYYNKINVRCFLFTWALRSSSFCVKQLQLHEEINVQSSSKTLQISFSPNFLFGEITLFRSHNEVEPILTLTFELKVSSYYSQQVFKSAQSDNKDALCVELVGKLFST